MIQVKLKAPFQIVYEDGDAPAAVAVHDIGQSIARERNRCRNHVLMAEAFPCVDRYTVPCALALFMGCEPVAASSCGFPR